MADLFLKIVNMSISASWIVLAVLLLRLLLKKAPKWIAVLLWGIVAIRLICPFTIESVMSLMPDAETISPEIMTENTPAINTGVPIINNVVNPVIGDFFAPEPTASVNPLQILIPALAMIWIVGIFVMLAYTVISYVRLKSKVCTAVLLRDNIYQSENVGSPFVLGIIKPRIYLPFQMNEQEMDHVIAHEKAHVRRKDHVWKPFGFLVLALHWFNPLMWLGYVLLCRDIELACDEKVVKEYNCEQKADYSQALLTCSVKGRMIAACPLAFGEVGVKDRVRSVLNYKKPAFWMIVAGILICAVAALCFLTNPPTKLADELSVFVDMEIAGHNKSKRNEEGIFSAVHHKVLGIDRSLNQTTVYLWAMYQEYSYENGVIKEESGARSPVVVTAKRTGKHGHYELVEYWQPRDGSYYVEDIKGKFPWYLHGKALDSQRYVAEQEAFCRKAAEECFASAGQTGGADTPSAEEEYVDGHPFFYGTVLEIYDGSIRVEVTKDSKWIGKGTECIVSTKVINEKNALPEFKVGSRIAVVFDGSVQETYPVQINFVYAIYPVTNPLELTSPTVGAGDSMKEPPVMVVVSNEQSVVALAGASTWIYMKENGESVTACGDPMHPESAKRMMPCIDLLPTYFSNVDPLGAYLLFNVKGADPICSVSPDEIQINCWEEKDWGKSNAKSENVSLNVVNGNLFFNLKDGNYVYEVTATWKKYEKISGTVRYAFYTAKPDLNWKTYPKIGVDSKIKDTYNQTSAESIEKACENGELVITKTHHQMDDGLWVAEGYGYLYRLEITGRLNNAAKNTTYIVLSNRKDVTFDETWKASGFSSNSEDYFKLTDAVIVGYKSF